MYMLSNSSKYAINAVLYIAVNADEENKLRVKEIAEALDVPSAFLAKLLQELSRKNVISSSRGPTGGFYLTEENRQLYLVEIVKHMDGLDKLDNCILGLKRCSNEKPCPVHYALQPLKTQFLHELRHNTIASFAEKVKDGETFLFLS